MHDVDDHYHDHEGHEDVADMPLDEKHLIWSGERVELKSVGIDIGSSTSHLVFSQIILRRKGLALSSQFQVVSREIIHESSVILTPFANGITIDTDTLSSFISKSYKEAGLTVEDIDTGAVILTGEAARKENAEAIAALFSKAAGKFVCATAGPNLEARMAAYGSGAVEISQNTTRAPMSVMNVDIGGGTSKIAIIEGGRVIDTVSLNVGARLIVLDDMRQIVRIEEMGKVVLDHLGLDLKVGDRIQSREEQKIARTLANCLFEVLQRNDLSPLTQKLMITRPLSFSNKIDTVLFSGGVSEYVYEHEDKNYGDLGIQLAIEIRQLAYRSEFGIHVGAPIERIRATVIGASQYTIQVSGNTIFISRGELLPIRNIQVIALNIRDGIITRETVESAINTSFSLADLNVGERMVALAIHWPFGPSYQLLRALAEGISSALGNSIGSGIPLVLVFDNDIAKLVGNILIRELFVKCDVVSIDGIDLQDFDYIDIGEELSHVAAVPVIIKSLVFRC